MIECDAYLLKSFNVGDEIVERNETISAINYVVKRPNGDKYFYILIQISKSNPQKGVVTNPFVSLENLRKSCIYRQCHLNKR